MQYDVKVGAAVAVTMTTVKAAKAVASCLGAHKGQIFQASGLAVTVVEVDRAGRPKEPDIWGMTVPVVEELVANEPDPEVLALYRSQERQNPKHEGGRTGVLDAIAEQLGEAETTDEDDEE